MAPRWVVGVEVMFELVEHVVVGVAVVESNVCAEGGFADTTRSREHTTAQVQNVQQVV